MTKYHPKQLKKEETQTLGFATRRRQVGVCRRQSTIPLDWKKRVVKKEKGEINAVKMKEEAGEKLFMGTASMFVHT
jgi:hypothetical protein